MRRTKVVCTIGPSSSSPEMLRALIASGMDVARLNFSHGTPEEHRAAFQAIRAAARELGRNVAVMADLQGPKIRTGPLQGGVPVQLVEGAALCITTRPVMGDATCVSTTYLHLAEDLKPGDRIMVADGTMELKVDRVEAPEVRCRVVRGGMLGEHKGINLVNVNVSASSLTDKDVADLEIALGLGVDYVALSFVRKPEDLTVLRSHIERLGEPAARPSVVSKIERPEALAQFDAILALSDAVMVARGDLGIEADLDSIPQIQKGLIRKCNAYGIPVITATQMLESMTTNPRPTRAEVSDVANAIYDGTDAVMLSGETAAGQFPVDAARSMVDIAEKADQALAQSGHTWPLDADSGAVWRGSHSNAIGHAVAGMTQNVDVVRIVCFTLSGHTARAIARHRPHIPITAVTLTEQTLRRCALVWGVEALRHVEVSSIEAMIGAVDGLVIEQGLAQRGDTIIIVGGAPLAVGGVTNLLTLHRVGDPA